MTACDEDQFADAREAAPPAIPSSPVPERPTGAQPRFPWFQASITILGGLVLMFVLAPLLGMVLQSSFGELRGVLADPEVTGSIRLTLLASACATVVCTLAGVPMAYLLARKRFAGRSLLLAIVDLPVIIPHSAAGVALLTLIGRNSPLGRLTGGSFVGTSAGIAVAMAFVSLPFLISAAREAFAAVPPRLENVARTLGASPSRVFFTISVPLAWRGIASGMILMWARGISEFGAVVIIAYHPMVTPVLVFERFNDFGLAGARAVAVLLVLVCVTLFILFRLLAGAHLQRNHGDA